MKNQIADFISVEGILNEHTMEMILTARCIMMCSMIVDKSTYDEDKLNWNYRVKEKLVEDLLTVMGLNANDRNELKMLAILEEHGIENPQSLEKILRDPTKEGQSEQ